MKLIFYYINWNININYNDYNTNNTYNTCHNHNNTKKKKKKKTLVIIKFHRLSNCYFLLGMIATMTGYSSINPISQAMPLIFVLGVTAIKDAFSDYVHIKINKINK